VTLVIRGYSEGFNLPGLAESMDDWLNFPGWAYSFLKELVVCGALIGCAIFLYYRLIRPKERLTCRSRAG